MSRDRKLLALAFAVAEIFSKDPTTKVGALAVGDEPNEVAYGYNGLPPGLEDTLERLSDRDWKNRHTRHAEANALSNVRGFVPRTIYATRFPCRDCALDILAARTIRRIVTIEPTGEFAARWGVECDAALELFDEAGIEVAVVAPPSELDLATLRLAAERIR